ncbi:ABC transporter FUM19 [Apiospora aurea]|uniref:ABC transporter FUM19 n=1 Tax=Apiospora aurea TaxID=335848 RepID=A0ABR1PWS7_9PEZI
MACPDADKHVFGPWAGPLCRGGLDFTFPFELVFFTLLPTAAFVSVALCRAWPNGRSEPILCTPGRLRPFKLTLLGVTAASSVAFLALTSLDHGPSPSLAIGAASVECLAILLTICLSSRQHKSSPRPSTVITLYLISNVILNLPTARTLWLIYGPSAITLVYLVEMCLKAGYAVAENIEKKGLLIDSARFSPEELAGPVSFNMFGWLWSLLHRGYTTLLTISLLIPLATDMRGESLAPDLSTYSSLHFLIHHDASWLSLTESAVGGMRDQLGRRSLLAQLVSRLRRACLVPIIPRLFLLGFTLAQPFLIFTTVEYISVPFDERVREEGRLLVFAFLITFVGYSLSNALYWHLVNRLMMKVRGSLVALIYSSSFSSVRPIAGDTASLTLMTVDVEKAMLAFEDLHELWVSLIHVAIAVYVLAVQMSWACIAPILVCIIAPTTLTDAVYLVCLVLTAPIAGKVGTAQKSWNSAVQLRINMTAAVLTHLKEIRLLGLGARAAATLRKLRKEEVGKSQLFRVLMVVVLTLSQVTVALGPFATFALYSIVLKTSHGGDLLPAQAFTSLSLVNLIASPIGTLVQAIPSFMAGMSSLSRIHAHVSTNSLGLEADSGEGVYSDRAESRSSRSAAFVRDHKDEKHLTQVAEQKDDEAFVGSLKSASFGWEEVHPVLKDIEVSIRKGSITAVLGPVGSGKSTLLLGLLDLVPFSSYSAKSMPRHVSFCPQDPWLVSGTIRRNIVCGGVYDPRWYNEVIDACCLVEDFKSFGDGDLKEAGNHGGNLSGGQKQRTALARAVYAQNSLLLLDDPLSGVDRASIHHVYTKLFSNNGLLRRHNATDFLAYADNVLLLDGQGALTEVRDPAHGLPEDMEISAHPSTVSDAHSPDSENVETPALRTTDGVTLSESQADLDRKTGDISVYWFYVLAAGRPSAAIFILFCAACAFCFQFTTIWVQWWSDAAGSNQQRPLGYYLGIFAALCFGCLVGLAFASWTLLVRMVSRAALRLHSRVLEAVFRAPVSYLSSIDNGSVLNRFNQDMQLIDYNLPVAGVNTYLFAAICLVQAIIICTAAKYVAIAIPFFLVIIVFVQRFYLKTSRQLRLLDIEAKSPLYGNFQDTIRGQPSLRAYGGSFGSFLVEDHRRVLDESQQPIYLLYTVQRWLALVLDLLVAGVAVLLVVVAVEGDRAMSGSDMGVALVSLTSFNNFLTLLIRFWASMETSLGAIARVRSFPNETPVAQGGAGGQALAAGGRAESGAGGGGIEFRNVTARHTHARSEEHQASGIMGVDLTLAPGTKAAIVGRSGSGKSSLISSLLRLLPVEEGQILVDGVDISTLDQDIVQGRINAIAQASFFFPGQSLHDNLDPLAMPDSEVTRSHVNETEWARTITEVLENLNLWTEVQRRGGLQALYEPGAWSAGQLQLLGLARAIFRHRILVLDPTSGWKILVLDEATSSVDGDTAALMRKHINKEFADYTVLSIVHNLEGVAEDMDRMVMMVNGRIARDGKPWT